MWSNIKNIFEEMLGYKTTRTTSALNSRFSRLSRLTLIKTIQLDLSKYYACVLHVQTAPTSGFNATNNVRARLVMFPKCVFCFLSSKNRKNVFGGKFSKIKFENTEISFYF